MCVNCGQRAVIRHADVGKHVSRDGEGKEERVLRGCELKGKGRLLTLMWWEGRHWLLLLLLLPSCSLRVCGRLLASAPLLSPRSNESDKDDELACMDVVGA